MHKVCIDLNEVCLALDMSDVVCLVALVMYDKDAQVGATDIKNLSQGAQTVFRLSAIKSQMVCNQSYCELRF